MGVLMKLMILNVHYVLYISDPLFYHLQELSFFSCEFKTPEVPFRLLIYVEYNYMIPFFELRLNGIHFRQIAVFNTLYSFFPVN